MSVISPHCSEKAVCLHRYSSTVGQSSTKKSVNSDGCLRLINWIIILAFTFISSSICVQDMKDMRIFIPLNALEGQTGPQ